MNAYTLYLKPNQPIDLPALCVHCAQPANSTITIKKQLQQRLRTLAVPICDQCARIMRRKSMKEEQRQKLALFVGGGIGVILLAILLLLTPTTLTFWVRFLMALLVGGVVATAVALPIYKSSQKATLPEKRNILQSAQIGAFDNQTTTLLFKNPTFAERFRQLNQSLQMERQKD